MYLESVLMSVREQECEQTNPQSTCKHKLDDKRTLWQSVFKRRTFVEQHALKDPQGVTEKIPKNLVREQTHLFMSCVSVFMH